MAGHSVIWGIDIGQTALKALRCRLHDNSGKVLADAFDYIEYPKILSQPGAEPAELIAEALQEFLSRNPQVRGEPVAISVAGQNGLARFIKLPPVESKKIPDIVKYEARQQIPFDLNDVVWDFQRMGGSTEEEGFSLETEIGLFAMKRDQVFRALEPFQAAGIEVDYVQLTPLTLYNFVLFDRMQELPPPDEYDPDNPPESVVLLSLGTDASDLVVTNGFRVWQRSIPIGGNHFTKALTKELKLTFAKAEHLKRNASTAQDPTTVLRAMKPVFNDLLTEVQRSISYFTNIERTAKISQVMAMGNGMKLLGLRKLLAQGLGYDVVRVEEFETLTGSNVLGNSVFKENLPSFAVCYGLCLQGLGKTPQGIRTNLLPSEIVKDRLIRRKKPWAVAAAALILLGCTVSFVAHSRALATVAEEKFGSAEREAASVFQQATNWKSEADKARSEFSGTDQIGQHLVGNIEGRVLWLELMKAVNACLPVETKPPLAPEDLAGNSGELELRNQLFITNMEVQRVDDASQWWTAVKQWYEPMNEPDPPADGAVADADAAAQADAAPADAAPADAAAPPDAASPETAESTETAATPAADLPGPTGEGYIVMITGHHYHNAARAGEIQGAEYVRKTFLHALHNAKIALPRPAVTNLTVERPASPADSGEEAADGTAVDAALDIVPVRDLGIAYPVLVSPGKPEVEIIQNPYLTLATGGSSPGMSEGMPSMMPSMGSPMMSSPSGSGYPSTMPGGNVTAGTPTAVAIRLRRFDFVVHFFWKPTPPSARLQAASGTGEQPAENTTAATM